NAYLDFYRTEGASFRVNVVSQATLQARPGLDELLKGEVRRLGALLDRVRAAELYESTAAMIRLAQATIDEYERRKRGGGFPHFADPLSPTVRLLSRGEGARW